MMTGSDGFDDLCSMLVSGFELFENDKLNLSLA